MELSDYLIEPEFHYKRNKYTTFPICRPRIWELYKTLQSVIWTREEVPFTDDKDTFDKLDENMQHVIKMILAFFASSDGIVQANLVEKILSMVGNEQEFKSLYTYQLYNESIHSETYSAQIQALITDENEMSDLFNAIESFNCVREKAEWAEMWINNDVVYVGQTEDNQNILYSDKNKAEMEEENTFIDIKTIEIDFPISVIAFAVVEGVFFSGSFCVIDWLRSKKISMSGLIFSNELISRDEGLHTDVACALYDELKPEFKPSQEIIHIMYQSAVEIEKKFTSEAIPIDMIGMNSRKMNDYIEYVTDRLLVQLGYEKLYNHTECPFDFVTLRSLRPKTNFFEKHVGEYSNASISDNMTRSDGTTKPKNHDDDYNDDDGVW
jgi:ribonucleoside-diphosphate reductase beta chain